MCPEKGQKRATLCPVANHHFLESMLLFKIGKFNTEAVPAGSGLFVCPCRNHPGQVGCKHGLPAACGHGPTLFIGGNKVIKAGKR